jgi:hypothetical protein
METPKQICKKYCKDKLQHVVDDKPCPFSLRESSIEIKDEGVEVHTVCEGGIEPFYNTIIDRIVLVTQKGINVIREIIKHEKLKIEWPKMDSNTFKVPYKDPNIGHGGQTPPNSYPWSVTYSDNTYRHTAGGTSL